MERKSSFGGSFRSDSDRFDEGFVANLSEKRGSRCCSIVIPTSPTETKDAPIALKHASRRLAQQFPDIESECREGFQRVQDLQRNGHFWAHQANSLLIYFNASEYHLLRIQYPWPTITMVGDRFYTLPAIADLKASRRYMLLTVSLERCTLFTGNDRELRRLDRIELPAADEFFAFEERERQIQFHTQSEPRRGVRAAMFFGHGSHGDQARQKEEALRYLREVAKKADQSLEGSRLPLILAGPEHVLSVYRDLSGYKHIMPQELRGDYLDQPLPRIHELVWPLAAQHFIAEEKRSIARITETPHRELVINDLENLLPAAVSGAIDLLYLAEGASIFGRYEQSEPKIILHSSGEELLNLAAAETFLHDGAVTVLSADVFPFDPPLSGLLRYPLPVRASLEQSAEERGYLR